MICVSQGNHHLIVLDSFSCLETRITFSCLLFFKFRFDRFEMSSHGSDFVSSGRLDILRVERKPSKETAWTELVWFVSVSAVAVTRRSFFRCTVSVSSFRVGNLFDENLVGVIFYSGLPCIQSVGPVLSNERNPTAQRISSWSKAFDFDAISVL